MNVIYTDRARQRPEDFVLLQQATKQIPDAIGPAAAAATFTWDRVEDDQGRAEYTLRRVQFATHSRVLRALSSEGEHDARPRLGPAANQLRAACKGGLRFIGRRGTDRESLGEMMPPRSQRAARFFKRDLATRAEVYMEVCGCE